MGILPEEADLHTAEARVNKHKADWRGWKFMWPFAVVFVFVFIIIDVRHLHLLLQEADGRRHQVRRLRELRPTDSGSAVLDSVGRVTIFTVFQVPIMLFLAAAMALALDSMKLHGTKFFRISTFLPMRCPQWSPP